MILPRVHPSTYLRGDPRHTGFPFPAWIQGWSVCRWMMCEMPVLGEPRIAVRVHKRGLGCAGALWLRGATRFSQRRGGQYLEDETMRGQRGDTRWIVRGRNLHDVHGAKV
jgi:hypothetical protein